jgi:hypothetical protein
MDLPGESARASTSRPSVRGNRRTRRIIHIRTEPAAMLAAVQAYYVWSENEGDFSRTLSRKMKCDRLQSFLFLTRLPTVFGSGR